MKKSVIFVFFIFYIIRLVYGKTDVRIEQIIPDNYPLMEAFVSVEGKNGPVENLTADNFTAKVDRKKIEVVDALDFERTDTGIAYAVVLTAHFMMPAELLAQQKQAVAKLIGKMSELDTLSVYYFGDKLYTLFEDEPKSEGLLDELEAMKTAGGSPKLYDSLVTAVRRLADAQEKRKVMIVISDGGDMGSRYTKDILIQIVNRLNIPIYGCGIFMLGGRHLADLQDLSNQTGGGYMNVRYSRLFGEMINRFHRQITTAYVLQLKVQGIRADDSMHPIKITVTYGGGRGSGTKTFEASKTPVPLIYKLLGIAATVLAIIIIIICLVSVFRRRQHI